MLKTVKSPYLCNRLTYFDEIWHDEAASRSHSGNVMVGNITFLMIFVVLICRR